jgi:EAL domain-containing protein (putative c-di-GMP-specific phosphodiesterase class I)
VANLLGKLLAPGALSTVFQPIYEINGISPVPIILECLSRGPASTNAAHAGVLFEYAQLKGAEHLVDRACITAALSIVPTIPYPKRFSLNVFAATLARDSGFTNWIAGVLSRVDLDPSNLVFEIVEHGEAWDTDLFLASLQNLRTMGATIALDDVGVGHSNFRRIIECDPDFLKLDQFIVRNCDRDNRRRALLRSLALLAADLGIRVVAEGVETEAELEVVRSHGIELLQGFLFSKPMPASAILDLFSRPVETTLHTVTNVEIPAKYRPQPDFKLANHRDIWHVR